MSFIRSSSTMRLALNNSRIPRTGPRLVRKFASDGHNPVPFSHSNKNTFKYKYFAFLATGFSIPFIAVGYQLNKISRSSA